MIERRKPGRPRLNDAAVPSVNVQLRLPADVYDRGHNLARHNRESIQDLLRKGLKRILADERGNTF
jgi:hypothetical protein